VIDGNGYVRRSALATTSKVDQTEMDGLKKELATVKQELADLKSQVKALLEAKTLSVNSNLLEIVPVPFSNKALISYSIVDFKSNTSLEIFDAKGSLVKTLPINQASGQIELNNIEVAKGLTVFSIVSGGKNIISKKAIKM
jgi:hypothetical protein